eukprot:GHVH01008726.1.p1 GENE.GHVH01008726.1~~GHVH01008726.1.p1  ORF type:complete len:603 (+),score=91.88 GHVH01008726.1:910-2718(+)
MQSNISGSTGPSSPTNNLNVNKRIDLTEINQCLTSPKVPTHRSNPDSPRGVEIINNKHTNKGTAFTNEEREALHLKALLPPAVETLQQQIDRVEELMDSIDSKDQANAGLMKYQYLTNLRSKNETLFYAVLQKNIRKYMPFVYTPTVGLGCQKFSHIYNQSGEGLFLSKDFTDEDIRRALKDYSDQTDTQPSIIVATDGSRILGLGDLGINGMGIPIGKLALYVAAGGFHPTSILPITFDFGTGNLDNIKDPLYLGRRECRPSSEVFYNFTDRFMKIASELFPRCVIQFEDFENKHCFDLLERNRHRYRCFNDDIQGTGVVAAAGFLSALKYVETEDGIKPEDHRVVFYGFGSATAGVANQIVACLVEKTGFKSEDLRKMFYMVDSRGLCTTGRGDVLPEYKLDFARQEDTVPHGATLAETIEFVKPTALIGLSGQGATFTEPLVRRMAQLNTHPIVFALSNPTSKAECLFAEAMEWTDGKVVWAAGSPMPAVDGRVSPQGNNLYAFPGIGFGAWLSQASTITDEMMTAATNTISEATDPTKLLELYPSLECVSAVADLVAAEVMRCAKKSGIALGVVPDNKEDRIAHVKAHRYAPVYGSAM